MTTFVARLQVPGNMVESQKSMLEGCVVAFQSLVVEA